MRNILIATHSGLAQGFYESVKFFNNEAENIHYINAYVENNDFEEEFLTKVEELSGSTLFVFTDIPGGTVNRIASKYIPKYGYKVISGINLAIILEIALSTEELPEESIENMIASSREQLIFMNPLMEGLEKEEVKND